MKIQNNNSLLADKDVLAVLDEIVENISSMKCLRPCIPKGVLEREELVEYVLKRAGDFLFLLPLHYKNNKRLVEIAISNHPSAILAASEDIKNDETFIKSFLIDCYSKNNTENFDFYFHLPSNILKNKDIASLMLTWTRHPFNKYDITIQEDKNCALLSLEHTLHNVIYINPAFLNDDILLKYLQKRPDLIIDRCSENVKKDTKLIMSLLERDTAFFLKVFHYYEKNKVVLLRYVVKAGIGEIKRFPILHKDRKAIRYLIVKGLKENNNVFYKNWNDFINCIEYEDFKEKLTRYIVDGGDADLRGAFSKALSHEVASINEQYLKNQLDKYISQSGDEDLQDACEEKL